MKLTIFGNNKRVLIGMIHLLPTMSYGEWPGIDKLIDKAAKDLKALEEGGADAALIENDGDHPCQVQGQADVVIPMAVLAKELSSISKIPLGVEVLLNDPKASLMIAKTCGLQFIRTDYFVDKMTRDGYGEFNIDPIGIMEFKKKIEAEDIKIFADIQVKYAEMIDKNKSIAKSAEEAIQCGADAIIVSGTISGIQPTISDIEEAKLAARSKVPVIIGSGFSIQNAEKLLEFADWAIVGNSIKTKGFVDTKKVTKLVELVKSSLN